MICLLVLTQFTNVTDTETHTQRHRETHRHRITAKAALDASIARQKLRGNNKTFAQVAEPALTHPQLQG